LPLSAHLVHGGFTYAASIHKSANSTAPMSGATTFEFRPAFVDTWKPCDPSGDEGPKCESPRLEVFAGASRVAVADFPQQQWTNSAGGGAVTSTPTAVPLSAPGNETDFLAVVNVSVLSPAFASAFLQPRSAQQVPASEPAPLLWTIRDVKMGKPYEFHLMAFNLTLPSAAQEAQFANYPKVGDAALVPMPLSAETVSKECQQVATAGLPAEEAPCSFSHAFDFSRLNPGVGDIFTIFLQWSEGDGSHVTYSPAFEIASVASLRRRRLQEQRWRPRPQGIPGRGMRGARR